MPRFHLPCIEITRLSLSEIRRLWHIIFQSSDNAQVHCCCCFFGFSADPHADIVGKMLTENVTTEHPPALVLVFYTTSNSDIHFCIVSWIIQTPMCLDKSSWTKLCNKCIYSNEFYIIKNNNWNLFSMILTLVFSSFIQP